MSTSTPHTSPTFDEIKRALQQISDHLLQTQSPLLPDYKPSVEEAYPGQLNKVLKPYHQAFLRKSRVLYQDVQGSDLHSAEGKALINRLKSSLNTQLLDMDLRDPIAGKSRKSYMTYEAGFTALEHEAKLGVRDRLLHPQDATVLEAVGLAPALRPGLYALRFSYQAQTVELAGAFVATEKNTPVVSDLTATEALGRVLLFTPLRGIEAFDSLSELNNHLLQLMEHPTGRNDLMTLLPTRYHALSTAGIWPLELAPIHAKPLFEHLFDVQVEKRTQDIDQALDFAHNPSRDPVLLMNALDRAISLTPPDLDTRLELRTQALLERHLRLSAPGWYRSANETRRAELADHLGQYNQARQALINLFGPAATPSTLARHQWLERLSDDLEIDDLEPEHVQVSTQRMMVGIGPYEQQHTLIELALRGLHTGDELSGSDFLQKTTLTYLGEDLPDTYQDLTPAWLAQQMTTLQPRIDFSQVLQELHGRVEVRQAIEHLLDRRINALAYTAVLQNHLTEDDFQLIQRLRAGSDPNLSASSLGASALSLHGAQLLDLWVLRQTDSSGTLKRVLLCTPEAPREQQFQAFDSEADCQAHILGWTLDNGLKAPPGALTDYLITRVPMRFRSAMRNTLSSLSHKPHTQELQEVTFMAAASYQECLRSMAEHMLRTRVDDYEFSTPLWYRSADADTRRKLLTASGNAENTLRVYNGQEFSEARFPSFTTYLRQQARQSLNRLLGRPQNDIDPDTVWAYSPPSLIGAWTPPPLTYTQLYRDGYADGIGFLDEKFSRSARFKGPNGIDLCTLTAERVARSVTGVWIGQRYVNHLRTELLDPKEPSYEFRRKTVLAITQWQLQSAALESQLQGHIAKVDLNWLELSIASLGDTSASTRGKYEVHRLLIDGEWVIDTWLFSHLDNPVLLYTPQAPDGISFREARLFNYLLKKQSGWIAYFTDRVGVQSQNRVRTFLEEAKRLLPEQLDRTSVSPARYDTTRSVPAVTDLRQALYNMKLQRKIDDVQATTVNRTQMITGILWTCVEWVAAIATAPFPILSLSTGLLLAFKDTMLALHAYNQGDTAAAFEHFLGYLFNSAGALLTDLRPALYSINPMAKALRVSTAGAEQSRALQLIKQLEPAPPTLAGMQPVVFNGQPLWAPTAPDAIGRYLLHRLEPASGELVSTSRLVVQNTDGTWVRSGVTGGAPKYESVPESPGPQKDYGMPAKHWRDVEIVMDPQMKAKMLTQVDILQIPPQTQIDNLIKQLQPARTVYQEQVGRLARDAQDFFTTFVPLPAVADIPAIDASSSFAQLLTGNAFAGNKPLIVGAIPGGIAGKQVLIDNFDALIEQGFRTLYVEYLPGDVFRVKLDKLNSGQSWHHIKLHLSAIDQALGFASGAEHSYLALVRKAREKGMKVKALDASTSYYLDSAMLLGDVPPTTPRDNKLRNFYSHKVIEADMADNFGERWVALVEPSRLRTFKRTPGLADLQDAVALRIEDVGTEAPTGLRVDTPGSIPGDAQAKGDYLLTRQTAYKAPAPVTPAATAPAPRVEHFSDFDIPASLKEDILILAGDPHGLDSRYAPFHSTRLPAFNQFIELRTQLRTQAEGFFADYAAPPRQPLPAITATTTPQAFLKQIGDSQFAGLVIGEGHSHEASKALLRTQMKKIKEAGFKTLYVEHLLTDMHQAELDLFLRTQRLPPRLKTYLRHQDAGHMPMYSGPDTYSQVIQAANKYGLRVRALDCTVSYHVKGLADSSQSRNQMFSYFAAKVIEADQAAQGAHKWIAFVGSAHTNNNIGVPGLAEMLGAVSLHVRDTAPTLARGIHLGYWETDLNNLTSVALRSDFKLEIGKAGRKPPNPFVPVDRSRLTRPGYYLLERPSTAETRLVHRSNSGEIITTPIQVDDNGFFFIDRWGKREQRFKVLLTLESMLRAELKLTPAP